MKTQPKSLFTSLAVGLLIFVLHTGQAAEPKSSRLDLTGIVRTMDGQPLQDASVFIYTAGPRVGAGFI